MSKLTEHGNNISNQIQDHDAYGDSGELTLADVWLIVDNLHSHFIDTNRDTTLFEGWMDQLEKMDSDLPAI